MQSWGTDGGEASGQMATWAAVGSDNDHIDSPLVDVRPPHDFSFPWRNLAAMLRLQIL
jgi:hypothetical protein